MKRIMKKISISTMWLMIVFGAAISISAQANYMTSFGLKLGAKYDAAECPIIQKTYLTGKRYEDYAPENSRAMCFMRDLRPYFKKGLFKDSIKMPLPPLFSNGDVILFLPKGTRTDYLVDDVRAYIIDGNFVGVEFLTGGFKTPDAALVFDLTEKYGKPTKITPIELQNDYGAKYTAYAYEWQLSGLSVFYDGYKGTVSIVTPPLARLRVENDKKSKTKNPL